MALTVVSSMTLPASSSIDNRKVYVNECDGHLETLLCQLPRIEYVRIARHCVSLNVTTKVSSHRETLSGHRKPEPSGFTPGVAESATQVSR